ncbi:unnamed protein product [Ectocarpus fasciculatus]
MHRCAAVQMPAPGFAALFEVAALSAGLTVAGIVGSRFVVRWHQCSGTADLSAAVSGLAAALLTLFFCLYGLAYWFNGIGGYDCLAFSTVMGASLSASNALAFIHLFILSDSMHRANSRWKHFRWLGVIIVVFHWVALVALEGTRTAGKEERGGCAGESRCVTDVDGLALTVKWVAQLLNQLFQTVAFLVPLPRPATGAANDVRLFSGGLKATGSCRKCLGIPVWQTIISEGLSLVMTITVAGIALAKAKGGVDSTPMFAVEVLDNIVNLAAIFYAVHARPKFFHPRPKSLSQLLDSASSGNTSSSLMGSFGGNVPFGGNASFGGSRSVGAYRGRRRSESSISADGRGYAEGGSGRGDIGGLRGSGYGNSSNVGGRLPRPHSIGVTSSTPSFSSFHASSLQRRYSSGPIRRLPPVVDMSPESSGHGSPSRSSFNSRGQSPPPAAPSSNLPPKSEPPAASAAPSAILPLSSGTPSAAAGSLSSLPPSSGTPFAAAGPLSSLRPASGTPFAAAAPSPSSPPPTRTPSVVAGPSPSSPPLTGTPSVGPGPSPSSLASARTPGVAEVSPSSSRGTPYPARARGAAEKGSGSGRHGRPVGALYFSSRATKSMRRTPGSYTTGTASGNADGAVVNTGIAFTRGTPIRSMSARAAGAKHDDSISAVRSASTASVTTGGGGTAAAGGTAAERIPSRCSSISTMPAAAPELASDDREHDAAAAATARLGIPDAVVTSAPWKWHQQPGLAKLQRPFQSTNNWASSHLMKVALATDASSGSFSAVSSETTSSTSPERHAEAHKKMATETPDGVRIAAAAAAAAAAHTVVWPLPLNASGRASPPPGGRRHARLSARSLASLPSAAQGRTEKKEARRTGSGSRRKWHHKKRAKRVTETQSGAPTTAASATVAPGGKPPSSFVWREVGLQGTGSNPEAPDAPASAASASTTNEVGASAAETGKRPPLERRTSSSATSRSRYSAAAWSAFSAASWCSSSFDGNDNQRGAPAATVRSPASFLEGNDSNG